MCWAACCYITVHCMLFYCAVRLWFTMVCRELPCGVAIVVYACIVCCCGLPACIVTSVLFVVGVSLLCVVMCRPLLYVVMDLYIMLLFDRLDRGLLLCVA